VIFQVAAAAILFFFQKFEILTAYNGKRPICVAVPNLIEIGQTVAEIWRFNGFFFSKWRPSAILDLLGAYWDHPRRPLDGLYRCAKFGWNWCSSFDNMKLSIFCLFGLKTPIQAAKLGFSGDFTTKMRSNVNETPKRHILARARVDRLSLQAWKSVDGSDQVSSWKKV